MADVLRGYHGDGGDLPPDRNASTMSSGCESSQPKRCGRGRNKKFFEKLAKNPTGPLKEIEIDMSGGQFKFVGEHGQDFTRMLSNQVRSVVPFNYFGWGKVPIETKRSVFPILYEYFNLARWEEHKEWESIKCALNFECSRAFSDWKNNFKKHFDAHGGYEDVENALANPPEEYDEEKWVALVQHFCSEKYMHRSIVNKQNRAKQKYPSLHGSKSLAQRRHTDGKNSMEIFHDTHTKNGIFLNPLAQKDYGKIQDEFAQATSESGDGEEVDQVECMKRALGERRGFVRGYGRVVRQPTPFLTDTQPRHAPPNWEEQLHNIQEQHQKEAAEHAQREAEQLQMIQEMQRQLQQQEFINYWQQQHPRPPGGR